MTKVFEKSSGGVVYRKRNGIIEVLLLSRKRGKNDIEYVLPKGHMEDHETAKDTAIREIAEETGLKEGDLRIIKFMTKINFSFVATYRDGNPLVNKDVYLFLVEYTGNEDPKPFGSGENITNREKFSGFRWFTPQELKKIHTKPDIASFIQKNLPYM